MAEIFSTELSREPKPFSLLNFELFLGGLYDTTTALLQDQSQEVGTMSAADTPKFVKVTQEEFDTTFNRIQLALAKHENVVKSWTAKSSRKEPTKTQGQLEAEDAALFRNEPPYLGVGAPIPANFLVSDAERNNKSLRAKFFPTKGLKASKPRDFEEKAASAKRALKEESSDDEGGRSSLGKAKKIKTIKAEPAPSAEAMHKTKHSSGGNERYSVKGGNLDVTMEGNGDNVSFFSQKSLFPLTFAFPDIGNSTDNTREDRNHYRDRAKS